MEKTGFMIGFIGKYNKHGWFLFVLIAALFLVDAIIFVLLKGFVGQTVLNYVSVAMFTAVLFYIFRKSTASRTIMILLVVSYLLKLAYVFLDVYIDLTFRIFNDYIDSYIFHKNAVDIMEGTLSLAENNRGNYPVFLSYFYRVFGTNRFMAQYLNVMLSALSQVMILGIGRILRIEEKKMIFPMMIFCLLPVSIPFSSMLIRESITIFFVVLSVYFFIKWYHEGGKGYLAACLLILLPAMSMHVGVIVMIPAFILVFAFYDKDKGKFRITWKSMALIAGVLAVLVLLFIFAQELFFDKFGILKRNALERLYKYLERNFGESAYLRGIEYDSVWDIIFLSLPRMFYFLFSPVPWDWRGLKDVGAFLADASLYLVFVVSLIPMYRKTERNKRFVLAVFIFQFIALSFMFAQGTFTAGAAMRHRIKILPVIMVVYMLSGDGDAFSICKRWKNFIRPLTYYIRCGLGKHLPDEKYIKLDYLFAMGKNPDLKNPVLYTEKLQWLKLHDRKELHRELADKIKVRDYIKELAGEQYLFPLYGIYDRYEDIDFEALPDQFVLKPNHTSGDYFICEDKSAIDHVKLRKMIRRWLSRDFYLEHREWQYKDLERKIICEKLMTDDKFGHPLNYKFFCFHGEPEILLVASGLGDSRTNDFFDIDFKPIEVYGRRSFEDGHEKPSVYDELVEMVRKLAKPFLHIRVDTYVIDGRIYLGEFTFHHYSGVKKWNPYEFDRVLGEKLTLPIQVN